jgi:D-inositol-3-phosphate glycosyltransferase
MRVLIVSTFAPPHVGGLEVIVAQQARSLAEMGHDVTVCTSRHDPALAAEEHIEGYRIVRVAAWNEVERRTAVPFPLWGLRSFARLAHVVRWADVVHVHDVYYQPSFLAGALARWTRRPLFLTQHVSIVEHDSSLVMRTQRVVYATTGALLWRWSRAIIAYNTIVGGFLAERGVSGEKVRLGYNGIDVAAFRPGDPSSRAAVRERHGLPQDQPVVLFAGRLVPKKGYRELVAAHDPSYHIVLVGPGPLPEEVPSGVTFTGPVDRSELLSLYQASDLFALPAVGEMLTLAMQEAMACGLPVVATADAAYDSYGLDPLGVALVPAEPAALRRTFTDILSDLRRWEYMSEYSRQLATERFDWRHNAQDLAEVYRVAIAGSEPVPTQQTPRRSARIGQRAQPASRWASPLSARDTPGGPGAVPNVELVAAGEDRS